MGKGKGSQEKLKLEIGDQTSNFQDLHGVPPNTAGHNDQKHCSKDLRQTIRV